MNYISEDNRYRFSLNEGCLKKILKYVKEAGRYETGGILIGTYNDNHSEAILKKVTGPPSDSKHGFAWFERGVKGLQKLLNSIWSAGEYYLGEWHFHPNASPSPSFQDVSQMQAISESKSYWCPEPILLIIGGDHERYSILVFVTLPKNNYIELKARH